MFVEPVTRSAVAISDPFHPTRFTSHIDNRSDLFPILLTFKHVHLSP